MRVSLILLFTSFCFSQTPGFNATIASQEDNVPTLVLSDVMNSGDAFVGAMGWGRGAGNLINPTILKVINRNQSGAGSMTEAMQTAGHRIIVYDVAGPIDWTSEQQITEENYYIAGQTAPGDGIMITGQALSPRAGNGIVRYLAIRPGSAYATNHDALRINYLLGNTHEDFIADHLSLSWFEDEGISITMPNSSGLAWKRLTIQNTIISEGYGEGQYGTLIGPNVEGVSLIQNAYLKMLNRVPEIAYVPDNILREVVEFDNNLIYKYSRATTITYEAQINVRNNIYKANGAPNATNIRYQATTVGNGGPGIAGDGLIHQSGNVQIGTNVLGMTGTNFDSNDSPTPIPSTSTYTPIVTDSLEVRLLSTYGNSKYRDAVDDRVISEYQNNTGINTTTGQDESDYSAYPTYTAESRPAGYDSIVTGMLDTFATEHGVTSVNEIILNWNFGTYKVVNDTNQTAFEIYLGWMAENANGRNDFEQMIDKGFAN